MAPANPLFALLVRLAPGLLLLQTAPAQSFGPQQVLSSTGASGTESVYATDLDGDGDADVLLTSL
ncbi:MAG: VCBS repeat-containing protein, partial [Planctomycetota bacterium]|nr:VCBS repeat-containing protein [Planctomycetota bacterium]